MVRKMLGVFLLVVALVIPPCLIDFRSEPFSLVPGSEDVVEAHDVIIPIKVVEVPIRTSTGQSAWVQRQTGLYARKGWSKESAILLGIFLPLFCVAISFFVFRGRVRS